ncbi:WD40-repeat-containing domain protein [Colletotrichum cereale]|nr:WD40-repeat-containing domain protein [Colletotrichum cereale]
MAEVLGLAVNIATVIDLSTKIAKVCFQYSKDVKNAREEIARLEEETLNLKAVAESASKLLEGPHGATLKTSQTLLGAAQAAASRLEAINVELGPSGTRKAMRRFGVRAFKWPFQSKDVENLVRDIERYTQMISTGLQIDQTTIPLSLDQKFVLHKLPTVPEASFDSHAEEHNPTCLPSTRVELLKELSQWVNDPSAEAVFWLNGMAGTGKSTIARTVAQSLAKTDQLGASFFFKRGEGDRGHASKLFTTIASQLVSRLPILALHVKDAIDADPAIHTKTLREQFNRLILEPLLKVQEAYQGTSLAIVVDALDECEQDNDIRLIIHLFSSGKVLTAPRFKVLLTSRPELPIRLGFSAVRGTYNNLVLHEIPAPVIEHDISAFLEYKLAHIRDNYNSSVSEERQLPPFWPDQTKVRTLVTMAIPLFIFAATTCRFLGQRRHGNPDQQLQRVLNYWNQSQESKADLVSRLDLTYRPALDQQLTDLSPLERNEVLQQFRCIVGTIILLSSPLSADAVAQLLDISRHSVEDRLDMLHSVLDVPETSASPVRLLHLSFRDFLVDPHYRDSNPFWIDEKEVHRQTATNCLRVMGGHLRENILSLKAPGTPQSVVDSSDIDACLPSQAKYACLYWTHHVEQAESGAELTRPVYNFLCRHFLHWLEVLGWLGRAYDSVLMLQAIQSIVAHTDGGALQEFVDDAIKFLQSNLHVISTAPLQLYSSVRVFTPQRSIVRRAFAENAPNWISLRPEPEPDWDQCLQKLEGHHGAVSSVAFSHDSTLIVSASSDQTVRVWRTDTGECIQTLEGHTDWVSSVAFSHDSTLIVSASYDRTVRVWRTETGECFQTLEGHDKAVTSAAFSHDSGLIVSASYDQTIQVWRTSTGECIQKLEGHIEGVTSAAFSHNSDLILSGSDDATVRAWCTYTGECIQEINCYSSPVCSASFSHDSTLIASALNNSTVRIWNAKAEKHTREGSEHGDAVIHVIISHNSGLIASVSVGVIRVWCTDTGNYIRKIKGHNNSYKSAVFSHNSALIASASKDHTIQVWCVRTGHCVKELRGHNGDISAVAFSHNSALIASASDDRTVRIWRTDTGKCIQVVKCLSTEIYSVAFSHNSAHIVSALFDDTIRIWRTDTGECTKMLEGFERSVGSAIFSHNSAFVVSQSLDRTIRVWSADTGDCVREVHAHWRLGWLLSSEPSNTCLVTNKGVIAFADSATGALTQLSSAQPCTLTTLGIGLSEDRRWITWNDQNLLWLPAEFRPLSSAVTGSTVVIGCRSGRVLIFRFSEAALRLTYNS